MSVLSTHPDVGLKNSIWRVTYNSQNMTQRYAQIADPNTSRQQPVFPVSAREPFEREPRLVASKYHILVYGITRSGAIMLGCRHF